MASVNMVAERFGHEIAEAFQLWTALQEDTEREVRNIADQPLGAGDGEGASSSGSSTVAVEREDHAADSCEGSAVARIAAEDEGQREAQEVERVEEANMAMNASGGDALHETEGCEGADERPGEVHPGNQLSLQEEHADATGVDGCGGGVCSTLPDSLPEGDHLELQEGLEAALCHRGGGESLTEGDAPAMVVENTNNGNGNEEMDLADDMEVHGADRERYQVPRVSRMASCTTSMG